MKIRRDKTKTRKLTTTIGNLVSAIYEMVPGAGPERIHAAAAVLAAPPLSRRLSRPVRIVA